MYEQIRVFIPIQQLYLKTDNDYYTERMDIQQITYTQEVITDKYVIILDYKSYHHNGDKCYVDIIKFDEMLDLALEDEKDNNMIKYLTHLKSINRDYSKELLDDWLSEREAEMLTKMGR